jgi:hypothetical protein
MEKKLLQPKKNWLPNWASENLMTKFLGSAQFFFNLCPKNVNHPMDHDLISTVDLIN